MRLSSFQFTGAGGRSCNEDACAIRPLDSGGLFVVADGLGGTVHGEQAAACVIECMTQAPLSAEDDAIEWLRAQFDCAQEKIVNLQQQTHANMKSTAVALLLRGEKAAWAHVGDSRLYCFHDGALVSVTEDHSVAFKKYKAGEITRAQIPTDEDQSALLRALGNPDRHWPDCTSRAPITAGDAFLLCSDGVWEYLHDGEILVDLLKSETAEDWGRLLLLRVLDRVGTDNDNLSLITVMVEEGSDTP